jgi:hypothetical protein
MSAHEKCRNCPWFVMIKLQSGTVLFFERNLGQFRAVKTLIIADDGMFRQ